MAIAWAKQAELVLKKFFFDYHSYLTQSQGPALADAGPNARPRRESLLSSDFMTTSCSVNRVTILVEQVQQDMQYSTNTRIEHVC